MAAAGRPARAALLPACQGLQSLRPRRFVTEKPGPEERVFPFERKRDFLFAALLAVLFLGAAFSGCSAKPRPSIVLVMIDTLRADRLGCYGFTGGLTPEIDRLAARGVLFKKVCAASSWTGPSVSSIVTGMYPDELGIHGLFDPLPPAADTLAERLRDAGYATGAVVSNAIISRVYGHDQGYDFFYHKSYREPRAAAAAGGGEEKKPRLPVFTADKVTDNALEWIAKARRPFFLYAHYTDPHEPYLPPAAWLDRVIGDRERVGRDLLLDARFAHVPLTPSQLDGVRASYEAEIAFTDHEVGRLLRGLPAGTIVVLTGDHGEEFKEHGWFLHGHTLFEELVHIPLVFAGPGIPRGLEVEEPASHTDITPTILDLAGKDPEGGLDGLSLAPFFRNSSELAPGRTLFSVLECPSRNILAARRGPWKLLVLPRKKKLFLINLDRDPAEQKPLYPRKHEDIVSALTEALRERASRVVPTPPAGDAALEEQRKEQLRAIGYLR